MLRRVNLEELPDFGRPELSGPDDPNATVTSSSDSAGTVNGAPARLDCNLSNWSPSRRPTRHPVRSVPHRHLLKHHLDGPKDPASWTLLSITSAANLGGVRTGMTYDKEYGTSAGFFEKPQRLQFLEGPNEPAVACYLEMKPRYLDFQFQALDMKFRRADGKIIHKYPDVGIEYDDNSVRFGEIKSDDSWFEAPGICRPLARIDQALSFQGLKSLLKIKGAVFRTDPVRDALAVAMDARLTSFDRVVDVLVVRNAVIAYGGCASYSAVVAALGGARAVAVDKLYAMLLRRIVDFDLGTLPNSETKVTLPVLAKPYALRALLQQLQQKLA
jgi:hypothetical protein